MSQEAMKLNGEFPAYAWPGGYPIIYYTKSGLTICPKCANQECDDCVTAGEPYYEGPTFNCDDCGTEIESAYGDPDIEREVTNV